MTARRVQRRSGVEELRSPEFLAVVPEDVRPMLRVKPEERTLGSYVDRLLQIQHGLDDLLDARSPAGKKLAARLGQPARALLPHGPKVEFRPVTEREVELHGSRLWTEVREAASCMGLKHSLPTWDVTGNAGARFS